MFAGLPPSSSDLAEPKGVFPPSPPAHSSPLGLVLAALAPLIERSAARTSGIRLLRPPSPRKRTPRLHSCPLLASRRLALVGRGLPRSLPDARHVCSLASSRTAARQPDSARRARLPTIAGVRSSLMRANRREGLKPPHRESDQYASQVSLHQASQLPSRKESFRSGRPACRRSSPVQR
jgi:hypothetical protein